MCSESVADNGNFYVIIDLSLLPRRMRELNNSAFSKVTDMKELYQRLRELDPDTFQRFCAQLLHEMYPNTEITHVEGSGGDQGLDVFTGNLSGSLVIWQCKAFSNNVGSSQRAKILKSLKTALNHFSVRKWILVLSVDLNSPSLRWFQQLQTKYRDKVEIELFPATRIVNQLIHRRALADHFFPGASIDLTELKKLALGTSNLTVAELKKLNLINVEDYQQRLKGLDPRCGFEVVYAGDGDSPCDSIHEGAVLSIKEGSHTVNVFARDVHSFNANPPTLELTVQGEGVSKFSELMRTGKPQEFDASDIVELKSNWPLIPSSEGSIDFKLLAGPNASVKKTIIRTRILVRLATELVEYKFIELSLKRAGKEAMELVSTSSLLPFRLSVVLPRGCAGNGSISFQKCFPGKSVRSVQKFQYMLSLLSQGGEIILEDLERENELASGTFSFSSQISEQLAITGFINDLVEIENAFGIKLLIPEKPEQADEETFLLLKALVHKQRLRGSTVTFEIIKSEENQMAALDMLANSTTISIRFSSLEPKPRFFGVEIETGPCMITVDPFVPKNRKDLCEAFGKASIGDAVRVTLDPESVVRYELCSDCSEPAIPSWVAQAEANGDRTKVPGCQNDIEKPLEENGCTARLKPAP